MSKHHDLAIAGRIRPARNLVLIQVLGREKRTAGGLHIPDNANGREDTALVLRIGSEVTDVKEGERVMFNPLKLRLVLANGPLANAQGTPYAGPGECAILHQDDLRIALGST